MSRFRAFPKLCGADIELGNYIRGLERRGGTGFEASRALLREIDGFPRSSSWGYGAFNSSYGSGSQGASAGTYSTYPTSSYGSYNPQDYGSRFLPQTGSRCYEDLSHYEFTSPESVSCFDLVGCRHAMLRITRQAQRAANAKLPEGQQLVVLANNSDGLGNSYGSHLDFLISRECYDRVFEERLHHALFLISFRTSGIVYTGAGKVGSENGRPPVDYQISQRADFIETTIGIQTTYRRPALNCRDEDLCGRIKSRMAEDDPARQMARLHDILPDNTLAQGSCVLSIGPYQVVLAMVEQGYVYPELILEDPVNALVAWSHDPSLRARAKTVSGASYTAVEMQWAMFEKASRFVESGKADGLVPRVSEVMGLWENTLTKLERRDFDSLAHRLDWVLKKLILENAISQHGFDWSSPEVKYLDQMYSSLDPEEGLFWSYARSGFTEEYVSEERIEHFTHEPPEDTRAWTRAMLLRKFGSQAVHADWDNIRFRDDRSGFPASYVTVDLPNPLGFTRRDTEHLFTGEDTDLSTVAEGLEALSGGREVTIRNSSSPEPGTCSGDSGQVATRSGHG